MGKFRYFLVIGIGVVALIVFLFFANLQMLGVFDPPDDGTPRAVDLEYQFKPDITQTAYSLSLYVAEPGYLENIDIQVTDPDGIGKVTSVESANTAQIYMQKADPDTDGYSVTIVITYFNGVTTVTKTLRYSIGEIS